MKARDVSVSMYSWMCVCVCIITLSFNSKVKIPLESIRLRFECSAIRLQQMRKVTQKCTNNRTSTVCERNKLDGETGDQRERTETERKRERERESGKIYGTSSDDKYLLELWRYNVRHCGMNVCLDWVERVSFRSMWMCICVSGGKKCHGIFRNNLPPVSPFIIILAMDHYHRLLCTSLSKV